MHYLAKKMIEFGAIDTEIKRFKIDEWFENVIITYISNNEIDEVVCSFENCFDISFKHNLSYSKGKINGSLDYKYFIQNIEITEENEFFIFKICAWPLDGKIICKKINIDINKKDF